MSFEEFTGEVDQGFTEFSGELDSGAGAGRGNVYTTGNIKDYEDPSVVLERMAKNAGVPVETLSAALEKAKADSDAFATKNGLAGERAAAHFGSIADIYIDDAINRWKLDNRGVGATLSGMSLSDVPTMVQSGMVGLAKGVNELIGNDYDAKLASQEQARLQGEYSNALRNDLSLTADTVKSVGESGTQMLLTAPVGGLVGAGAKAAIGATRLGANAAIAGEIASSVGAKAPLAARAINAAPVVAGAGAMESTLGGTQGASQAADEFDALRKSQPDLIRSSDAYKAALEKTGSDAAAMDEIRRDAVLRGGAFAALASAATAPIGGGAMEGFLLRRLAGEKLAQKTASQAAKETFKTVAAETGQEFVQSGAESVAGDVAAMGYNPEAVIDADKALLEASKGGIAGAVTAGVMSGPINALDYATAKAKSIAAERAKLSNYNKLKTTSWHRPVPKRLRQKQRR